MTRPPDKAHLANPAMTSLFHAGHQWRGVADARRWAASDPSYVWGGRVHYYATLGTCRC
jgi:hypothetical protein